MQIEIEKQDYEGRGITHIDGKIAFVPRMLSHEIGNIHIVKDHKTFSIGQVDSIFQKSEMRISSFCPYSSRCGGCVYDFVSYENSLKLKQEMLNDLMKQKEIFWDSISIVPSRPVLGYRNKGVFHVENGIFGYYEEESHCFVPIKKCELMHPKINEVLSDFSMFSFSHGKFTVRINQKEEILIAIETDEEVKIKEEFVKKYPILGILINHKCVYGTPFMKEILNDTTYLIFADSFFQVNPFIANQIKEFILKEMKPTDIVYDLYCGCGFFTFPISKICKKVYGVEVNQNAILAGEKMKQENHGENISFHVGKVENVLPNLSDFCDVAVIDPPRSGLDKTVIEYFLCHLIPKIIYVSCNPQTLARDLQKLKEKYYFKKFTAFDMFPFTKHVECVCVLELR